MPHSCPRTVRCYTDEFQLPAVSSSQQPGIQVQSVAAALEIRPFMLPKWRKDVRDGLLRGRARPAFGHQYSRRILASSHSRSRDARVTRGVLTAAVTRRRPPAGLIFHSDRGSEYLAAQFGERVTALGLLQSASPVGTGDNAHMESFFHSLKAEVSRGIV